MSMEIRAITATVQCQVSGGEGHLSAEVDSRAWGLNGGRTQYFPGDSAYILCSISKNVSIAGVAVIGGATETPATFAWDKLQPAPPSINGTQQPPNYATPAEVGYNVIREGISFNSPVSQIGKPPREMPIIIQSDYSRCGNPLFILNTTIVRLATWESTLSPLHIPPHGYAFVEYEPSVIIGKISNLGIPNSVRVFSYPNNVIIYGVATPMLPSY